MQDLQQQIIKKYGLKKQLIKLIEELRELETAIIKEDEENTKEEMADVLNLIEQIVVYKHWTEEIYRIKYFKIERNLKG